MNCPEARDNLKAYIDNELEPLARWRISSHLNGCASCREEMEQMIQLAAAVQGSSTPPTPENLRAKVMDRVRREGDTQKVKQQTNPRRAFAAGFGWGVAALLATAVVMFPIFFHARQASQQPAGTGLEERAVASKGTFAADEASPASQEAPFPVFTGAESGLLIIRTADLTVEVENYRAAADKVALVVKSAAGYITDSYAATNEQQPTSGNFTIRVPVESFDRTIDRLAELGTVKSKKVTGEDVTGQVVDIESKLRNKRAEEQQYLRLMDKAKNVDETVTVSNQLYRVRGEIEQAEGRLKYLKSAAAMSTISLTLTEEYNPNASASPVADSFGNAASSLMRTLKVLARMLIWIGIYSPIWLIPLLVFIYFRRKTAA